MTHDKSSVMTRDQLAAMLDHSVLKPEATAIDVRAGAAIVRAQRIGFYCVQPCWVATAARALAGDSAAVVAVVGFPHGCDRPDVKASAASLAVADGSAEIDMVMNFGALLGGDVDWVRDDIAAVVAAVPGTPVKVIIEAAALDDAQKRHACTLAVAAGAAFVKTSTGFHTSGGATVADVRLMRETVGSSVGVKASGGIRTLADVQSMIAAGANRIGTSACVAILDALSSAPNQRPAGGS